MSIMRKPISASRTVVAPVIDDEAIIDDDRRRYFDPALGLKVVQVFQGDYYVTNRKDEVLSTILGSCIAACVRDTWTGYGGMNHFLLPRAGASVDVGLGAASVALRYGSFAMEQLINDILAHGGRRERLEVKVFGGGNVLKGLSDGVGHKNADFIEQYLSNEGLPVASSHLRGDLPRKIQYFPATGRVRMRQLGVSSGKKIFEKETRQTVRASVVDAAGTIELFD